MKEKFFEVVKQYRSKSVFIRNMIIIIILIVIPLWGISNIYYNKVDTLIKEEINAANLNTLYRIRDITDALISQTNMLGIYMSQEDDIRSFMIKNPMRQKEWEELYEGINNEIKKTVMSYSYIDSIYVISDKTNLILNGYSINSLNDLQNKSWFEPYISGDIITNNVKFRAALSGYPYYLTITNASLVDKNTRLGTVIINIDIEELFGMVKNNVTPSMQKTYVVDDSKRVIYSEDVRDINNNIEEINNLKAVSLYNTDHSTSYEIDNQTSIVSLTSSKKYGWKLISVFPLTHYDEKINNINFLMTIITLVLIAVVILVSFIIAIITYSPITNILSAVKYPYDYISKYKEEKNDSYNEVSFIIKNIIQTMQKNKNMQEDLENKMILLNRAQTVALQVQINPHFLYNTLEAINWMAVKLTDDENDVSNTIDILSKLFRSTLDTKNYIITINEEIEITKMYIEILHVRYYDIFDVIWDVKENFMNKKVIKLILQPIIENSVYHGIRPLKEKGIIVIKATQQKGKMVILVQDNGVGMPTEVVQDINEKMSKMNEFESEHIGLYNVNQRIKLVFGDDYGVSIISDYGKGTKVRLVLPMMS